MWIWYMVFVCSLHIAILECVSGIFVCLCLFLPPPLVIRKRNITTQQIRASKQNVPPPFIKVPCVKIDGSGR